MDEWGAPLRSVAALQAGRSAAEGESASGLAAPPRACAHPEHEFAARRFTKQVAVAQTPRKGSAYVSILCRIPAPRVRGLRRGHQLRHSVAHGTDATPPRVVRPMGTIPHLPLLFALLLKHSPQSLHAQGVNLQRASGA